MKKLVLISAMAVTALLLGLSLFSDAMAQKRIRQTTLEAVAPETAVLAEKEPPEVIAIFGVDAPEGSFGRSDCILLASLEEGEPLRLCSLARDTLVTLPEDGREAKLGHAYALGGPEEALRTIQENFGIRATKYVSVNFTQMPQLVDLMGGVSLTLTREEWRYLGFPEPYLGRKRLTGEEALAYCRIRSLDNDDGRTARQRKVISALAAQAGELPLSRLPGLAAKGLSMCRTNMRLSEVLALGRQVLAAGGTLETRCLSIPGTAVSAWGGVRKDGIWYYVYDLDLASRAVNAFFRGEEPEKAPKTA